MSHPLTALTRTFATTAKPANMTLDEIDRLYDAVIRVITSWPSNVDLLALSELAQTLDHARRTRRSGHTKQTEEQLDKFGNEISRMTAQYFEVEALDPVTGNSDFAIVEAQTATEAERYAKFHYFTGHLVEATLIHPPMKFYGEVHNHV